MIVGCHEPVRNRYMQKWFPTRNESAAIVMGMGGKPESLLDLDMVREDQVTTIKRFSGGGTVVLDFDSIWVTIIGRPNDLVDQQYPRPIMEWTAQSIYKPMFAQLGALQQQQRSRQRHRPQPQSTMVLDTKSCAAENTGRVIRIPGDGIPLGEEHAIPTFSLRENDYILGERKVGGNAQSIGKAGWLHHTSFLWDYQQENMDYLTLPSKRPDYRRDRRHEDFLIKIGDAYPDLSKTDFFSTIKEITSQQFDTESIPATDAISIVNDNGGFDDWFSNQSRNKVLEFEQEPSIDETRQLYTQE